MNNSLKTILGATQEAAMNNTKEETIMAKSMKVTMGATEEQGNKEYKVNRGKALALRSKLELFDTVEGCRSQQSLVKINVLEKGFNRKVINVQEGTLLRALRTNESSVSTRVIDLDGYKKEYSKFNNDVVIINLSDIAETDYIKYFSTDFWISVEFNEVIVRNEAIDGYVNWANSAIVEGFNPGSEGYVRFKTAFMSPSQEKKQEVTCLKFNGDVIEFERILNSITNGLYSVLKTEEAQLGYTQLVKTSVYSAQGLAPNANMTNYEINSFALLLSKDKRKAFDGGGYFKSKAGFPIGLGAQMRNFGSDKWFGLSLDTKTINDIIKHHANGEVIYVEKEIALGNITRDEVQGLITSTFNRENRGPWAEKVIVMGIEYGTPDMFIDLNIVKTPMNFNNLLPGSLKILDLAGPTKSNGKVVMGSQMCFSLLLSEEGRQLMDDILLETISNALNAGSETTVSNIKELSPILRSLYNFTGTNEEKQLLVTRSNELIGLLLEEYNNVSPKIMTREMFEEGLEYSAGLIDSINPLWARTMDNGTKRNLTKALSNKFSNILSEIQPEVEGIFTRVLADPGAEFGVEILLDNEVFCMDLPLGKVIAIRSPKGGIREQGVYINLSLEEVSMRISNSNISNSNKRTTISIFSSLRRDSPVMFVPSSDEVKLLHSGMDFDFDGMTVITDKRVVDLLKSLQPVIVNVTDEGNTTEGQELFAFNTDSISILIDNQFNNGNLPVGPVCNHNHTWIMMLSDLKFARTALSFQFGASGFETEYKGLSYSDSKGFNRLYVEINAKKTDNLLEEFANLNFKEISDNDVERVINDINVIMNRYIQKTIDASKSGEKIEIPESLLINEVVQCLSLGDIVFSTDAEEIEGAREIIEGKLSVKIATSNTTHQLVQVGKKKKFIFNDFYHTARRDTARVVTALLKSMIQTDARLDEETTIRRNSVEFNVNEFITFKNIFGDLNAFKRNNLELASENEKSDINNDFRDTIGFLSNTIRSATDNLTAEERVLAAMDVATNKTSDLNAAASMFPAATLDLEYLILIAKHKSGINFVGSVIKNATEISEGQSIEVLENNILESKMTVEIANGIYTVREFDGKFYATESIESIITPMLTRDKRFIVRLSAGQDFNKIASQLGETVKITNFKSNIAGKDLIDLKHRLDLPSGLSNYANKVNKTESKVIKRVISTTKNKRGLEVNQMFLCLEMIARTR